MHDILDPLLLASDLREVRRVYADLIDGPGATDWDRPIKAGSGAWTLHETLAHLAALNGAGIDSIAHTLRGEPYTFTGLDDRYHFNAYNRSGIDGILGLDRTAMTDRMLGVYDTGARIACDMRPEQAATTAPLPIYNRRVRVDETLSIVIFHAGLAHAAQVAEPAGLPPLWTQLSPEFRHRVISRLMLCFSLLYRVDLAGALRDTIVFRVGGPDGGAWNLELRPDGAAWAEGDLAHPGLAIRLRDHTVLFRMVTGRISLPAALLRGDIRVRGHLGLFRNLGRLTSVDARPN